MTSAWPSKPLSALMTPVFRGETPIPGNKYRQIGVKLWGEGAYERECIDGIETKYSQLYRAESGDVILNKIWARNGSVAVVSPELAGCYGSGEFPMYSPQPELLLPEWIHWLTKTKMFWTECDAKSQGTSGKNRIRPEKFLEIQIPLPNIDEQRRIAGRIEAIASLVRDAQELRRQASNATDSMSAIYITEIFKSLHCHQKIAISALGSEGSNPIQIGPFGAQLHSEEYVQQGVPVLNVGNVWPTGLRLGNINYVTPEKAQQLARYSIQEDDLLFARSGATLGKVCLVPSKCNGWLMTGHLFRVRFDKTRCLPEYAFAALRGDRCIQEQIFGQIRGATRPGFNTTLLGKVELPIPPLEEQRRIVSDIEKFQQQVDLLKNTQEATALELDALLPAILDKAFKGELI